MQDHLPDWRLILSRTENLESPKSSPTFIIVQSVKFSLKFVVQSKLQASVSNMAYLWLVFMVVPVELIRMVGGDRNVFRFLVFSQG